MAPFRVALAAACFFFVSISSDVPAPSCHAGDDSCDEAVGRIAFSASSGRKMAMTVAADEADLVTRGETALQKRATPKIFHDIEEDE
mmetsp:Transcript_77683/g.154141  ORF Transcript_77683/g.154141 Transcript_77683/m.154141 type:complete len:87 (-) Transcript_77683:25-285(-)